MKVKKPVTGSILIVDDDHDLLYVLQSQLKKEGYKVYTNSGGEKLLEQIVSKKAEVVLLDLSMHMINGRELCRQIKQSQELCKTKVIIMSGNHDIESVAGECGADGFVAKPLSLEEIREAIEKFS